MVLKRVSVESGLLRTFKSGLPRSTHDNSTLDANEDLSYFQMSASMFSYANMEFCVGPHFPSVITPLLIMSVVT